ncbi:MAG: SH3 domain-containing protein [Alphaproteobacteria bacterium]|nr:SH3 domain-containing protein [Alphaproteobacteria bacterium]MCB9696630.1 SH3 domain-containing protein [Alphaproteobacteria bacterium]
MWLLSCAAAWAAPFTGTSVVATDAASLRKGPATDAELLTTLPLGASVDVLERGASVTLWGREAPWVRVHTDQGDGWLWSGLLSPFHAPLGDGGDGVVVAFRGAKLTGSSATVSVELDARIGGQLVRPERADLTVPAGWLSEPERWMSLTVLSSTGLAGAGPVARFAFDAQECAGLSGHMVWMVDGGAWHHLGTLFGGADAPVFATTDLTFPSEPGGKPGVVLYHHVEGESGTDGRDVLEVDVRTEHRWDGHKLQPALPR